MQSLAEGVAVAVAVGVVFAIIIVGAIVGRDAETPAARRKAASEQPLPRPLGL